MLLETPEARITPTATNTPELTSEGIPSPSATAALGCLDRLRTTGCKVIASTKLGGDLREGRQGMLQFCITEPARWATSGKDCRESPKLDDCGRKKLLASVSGFGFCGRL